MKVATSGLRQDSPSKPLLQALISYQGITDAAGAATGLTIVCGDLVNEPSYDGQLLKIRSGAAAGQVKPIYVQAGNTLTFATPWTNAAGAVVQITAGTLFDILSISAGSSGPGPSPTEGLSYYGVVDDVPGANQFTIGSLAGLGAGKFDGATNPYSAFVLRDAGGAGAAPQGELQAVTAYVTATGVFTTAAFTAAVAVGDEILIVNPTLAAALVILADLAVPAADSVANVLERDVIGNKTDTALYAVAANASLMRYIKALITAGIAVPGAVSDAGPAITDFDTDLTEATDDHYNGMLLMFINGPNAGQAHVIDDYAGAAKNVSFKVGDQWTDVPVNGNSFVILPSVGGFLQAISAEIDAIEVKLDTPANFMADVSALALEATLDTHDVDIKALLATIAGYIDDEVAAIIASQGRQLFTMDFWSLPQEEVAVVQAAGDKALPSVTVADLPGGAAIVRAIAMFKFRMVENHTYAGVNSLDGAQEIQVAGAVDAINFVTGQFTLAESTREGGDVVIGVIDIAATVNANGAYAFHWDLAKALQTGINFNDIQMGLRIWYSV